MTVISAVRIFRQGILGRLELDGSALLVDGSALLVDGSALLVDGSPLLVDGSALLVDGSALRVQRLHICGRCFDVIKETFLLYLV